MIRITSLVIIIYISMLLFSISISCVDGREGALIKDRNLEKVIKTELGIHNAETTREDLLNLTMVIDYRKNIRSLDGLEYCTNLTDLGLSQNNISDLTPLRNLSKLEWFSINDNSVSDLSPIFNLTGLTYLNISNNPIENLSSISQLYNLETLYASNLDYENILTDIPSLSNLNFLFIDGNNIQDMQHLSGLEKLETLTLSNNNISDIKGLEGLIRQARYANQTNQIVPRLGHLDLSNNNIESDDLSSLVPLLPFAILNLANNNITDITVLTKNWPSGIYGQKLVDTLIIGGNPLSQDALNIQIPELEAKGVTVSFDDDFPYLD